MPRIALLRGLDPLTAALAARLSQISQGTNWDDLTPKHLSLPESETCALAEAVQSVLHASVDEIIANNILAFVKPDGLVYPESEAQVTELSQTCTAVLQKLEGVQQLFATLSGELTSGLHARVSFSAYLSTADVGKLGMHVDKWDNVVVQLRGSKTFVFEDHDAVTLTVGDALSIPQDLRHFAETHDGSLHLSIILLRASWIAAQGWRD